ncbi:bone morphogenetic protein 1-like [Pomacea canaliculata]|uniref:bone morphogenetic protein 1-like n=1 Tax=Pomacea canaliculata TaxID=400727 RepID=UPI000D730FC3|nr:bone morphogenetic protein 1-like [Pomacea canaliculata]
MLLQRQLHFRQLDGVHWTITVGNGNRIDLYFTDVQLEWSNGCYNDNVMVWYDTSYEPTRLCYSYSYYFRSNQNSMTVVLLSTGNVTSKGFSAYWNTVCERSFPRDYNGTIESPGFPDEYYRGQNCRFSFSLSTYSLLRVIFTYFHLPNTSCDADYISVYNNSYHQRYCHNSPPPDLTDISEIRFVSNSSGPAGYGFQARVSRELKCGNTDIRLQENTQHYLSYYHYEYLNGRCEWTVTAEKGLAIMMIGYISCDYDDCLNRFIKIYNGTSKNPNSLITPRYHYYGEISVDEATNTIVLEYLADNSSYFYMSVTFMAYNATGHNCK